MYYNYIISSFVSIPYLNTKISLKYVMAHFLVNFVGNLFHEIYNHLFHYYEKQIHEITSLQALHKKTLMHMHKKFGLPKL